MAGTHAHQGRVQHLHVHGTSPVHRLAPEAKLLGLLAFVVVVALTPRRAVVAFGIEAATLIAVLVLARLPVRVVLGRLTVVVPFVLFAAFVPFVAGGEQVEVGWLTLSVEGLWAAWGIVAKATLGAAAAIVMSATTPIPDVLHGMTRLHLPRVLVAIIAFMCRYLDLLADQLARMRRAMTARGHDPRWLWQVGPIAASAGALFVRSYERGERVHLAMLARGFTGTMPALDARRATARDWLAAFVPGLVASAGVLAVRAW